MARLYIDGDEVRITRRDLCSVDVEFYGGKIIENLEPRRLFPVSGMSKYITLIDEKGKEQAIIRNIDTLMSESKKVIEACLREYYLIPKITRILEVTDKFGLLKWTVETDRGNQTFEIRNRHSDIKLLYDGRVLVRDTSDNRYEIPNYKQLDKHSLMLLSSEL
ncbi:MAG: DUF1854 domain-containing protein [Clostridia bacterium]|nr:DUF1854 domain-containing protein [Clostridia bacterium]